MSAPGPGEITVLHNPAASRFEARVGTQLAVADYLLEDGRIVFTHTYVPTALRGHGLAEQLVRAGLAFSAAEKRKVVPQCSYVESFIQRHKEFQGLV